MPHESEILKALDAARSRLVEATTFAEIMAVWDAVESLRRRAARAGLDICNRVMEVRLMAERKGGEHLHCLYLHGGDRRNGNSVRPGLEALGISKNQSARWQLESTVPPELFARYVGNAAEQGRKLSSAGLLRLARG